MPGKMYLSASAKVTRNSGYSGYSNYSGYRHKLYLSFEHGSSS